MWTAVSALVALISLPLILVQCRKFDDFPTRCLLLAIWLRYVLQAFPDYTVNIQAAGFSVVALASVGVVGLLALAADFRLLRLRYLLSIYLLIIWVTVSSLINGEYAGLVDSLVKWCYFLFLILVAYRAILMFGRSRVMYAICWAFFTPVVLMILSIALNHQKLVNEGDNSVSYIGGYLHEATISEILLTFVCMAILVEWRWRGMAIAMTLLVTCSPDCPRL